MALCSSLDLGEEIAIIVALLHISFFDTQIYKTFLQFLFNIKILRKWRRGKKDQEPHALPSKFNS